MIFITNSCKHLAKYFPKTRLGKFEMKKFKCGELYIRVLEKSNKIKNKKVVVIGNIITPEENIFELIFLIDALKRLGARIELIIPYFGYARQDRIAKKGEALSAEVICDILKLFKIKKIIVIDMHSERLKTFLKYKNAVFTLPFYQKAKSFKLKNAVVVSPDRGAVPRSKEFAKLLESGVAFLKKKRIRHNVSKVTAVKGAKIKHKNVFIYDDMIDTGGTIIEAAKFLKKNRAKDIYIFATHGLFSDNAVKKLNQAPIKKIFVTDTVSATVQIKSKKNKKIKKIKIIPIKKLLTELIKK